MTGPCKYCRKTHVFNAKPAAASMCVAKAITNNLACLPGYTDKSDGSPANTGVLVGDCKYCAPGYVENTASGICELAKTPQPG